MASNCLSCGTLLTPGNTYKGITSRCREHHIRVTQERQRKMPLEYSLLSHARQRARTGNYPCTITQSDIHIPTHCPILGIALQRSPLGGRVAECSPSIDKLVPALGYIPGNIQVISFRANRLKADASLEDIRALSRYMEKHLGG